MKWLVGVFFVLQCLQTVMSAKILTICAFGSHSHSLWCYKYMSALAERGHQITVLGVDEPTIRIQNLTTFIVNDFFVSMNSNGFLTKWVETYYLKAQRIYISTLWNQLTTKIVIQSKALKDLMKHYENIEQAFDLIIHDGGGSEALLGLVSLFGNPPLILATPFGSPQWVTFRTGNVFNPAYVPNMFTYEDQYMTFCERLKNTFNYVVVEWFVRYVAEPTQDKMMREVFGNNLPYVRDIAKQANIIIVNYHFALDGPRPLLPGVIGISGLHISEPQLLPQDIKVFMDGAEQGVILFSLGSNVDSKWFASFSQDFTKMLIESFRRLPQRVLWKWDKTLPSMPENIKVSNWLPQADILVHPKIRLFITHCGIHSIQEALYRKVPILGLPMFSDQIFNAQKLMRRNITIILNMLELTADKLQDGIIQILSNPMYKKNVERVGELMQDMPQTSKQQAVYWTEYAIRHKGAAHLRSAAADMPWHQLLLLDVLGVVLLSIFTTVWLIKIVILFMFRKLTISKFKTKAD